MKDKLSVSIIINFNGSFSAGTDSEEQRPDGVLAVVTD